MKQGRFNSIEEKRAFLRNRKKEQALSKDAAGSRRADTNDENDSKQPRTIKQIVQGGQPN